MRKILALSICLLFLPNTATADSNWLNYEKEAEVTDRLVCDGGKTNVTAYKHRDYYLYVAVTVSGEIYYFLITGVVKYFIKFGGTTIIEVTHDDWDLGLEIASPNWYAFFGHNRQHDCEKITKT